MDTKTRNMVTMREYNAFRLQKRIKEGPTLWIGGRLCLSFIIDDYTSMEDQRLHWYRMNQATIKSELYSNLMDAVTTGNTTATSIGKRLILPSSFTGGPRYMVQTYQDAITICRWARPPDLFIIVTCNLNWDEIKSFLELNPGLNPHDVPDVGCRAFNLKLECIMKKLLKGEHFGRVIAGM
ncbi:hypothetical protein IFM89_038699 [Coptis chinensis]|uniref:Helitron helicase-like domain-containing protein n=1 Tax=Coptis chinensis TaxID=261450 RepID=A0A835LFR5_9MAGN|nr:hypothetical protein IFM89_038699 [Coptis chinensis]